MKEGWKGPLKSWDTYPDDNISIIRNSRNMRQQSVVLFCFVFLYINLLVNVYCQFQSCFE